MALREFTDDSGVEWKAWDVAPEELHPKTAAEDYMADMLSGWLVFESATSRRRLAPYPRAWAEMAPSELKKLLARATTVPTRTHHLEKKSDGPDRRV